MLRELLLTRLLGGGDGGGSPVVEDGLITGALTECTNRRVTTIKSYAFYLQTDLQRANFPACISIGTSAFYSCSRLTSIIFPACVSIESFCFCSCSRLTNALFPSCKTVGERAFQNCGSIVGVDFPQCTHVGNYAFYNCSGVVLVNLPVCAGLGNYAFVHCDSLISINLPKCQIFREGAFSWCSKLTAINLPACSCLEYGAFGYCHKLSLIDLGRDATASKYIIGSVAFRGCSSLAKLFLRYPSLATLSNTSVFASTPMSNSSYLGYFGSIYVPASLVETYKSATNWAVYADRITAIVEEPALITFTVNGIEYQAEENMTWREFIESDYNVNSTFSVNVENIVGHTSGDQVVISGKPKPVFADTVLAQGQQYELKGNE